MFTETLQKGAIHKGCPHVGRGLVKMETSADRRRRVVSCKRTSVTEKLFCYFMLIVIFLSEETAITNRFKRGNSIHKLFYFLNGEFFLFCFCIGMFSTF